MEHLFSYFSKTGNTTIVTIEISTILNIQHRVAKNTIIAQFQYNKEGQRNDLLENS